MSHHWRENQVYLSSSRANVDAQDRMVERSPAPSDPVHPAQGKLAPQTFLEQLGSAFTLRSVCPLQHADSQTIWLNIDGMRLHCLTAGETGSPVVLLHGAGLDSATLSWDEVIGPLSAHHRIFFTTVT